MTNLLVVTQNERDELDAMLRRSVRPAPHGQAAPPLSEAIFLGAVRAIIDASVAAALAGQPYQVVVTQGEAVPDADRIIRGGVLLFHHLDADWALFGDEAGQLHVVDTAGAPHDVASPQLVDRPAQLLVDSAQRPNGSRGIRYRTLPLRPLFVRHTKMQIAFDEEKCCWYRSRMVEYVPAEHDPGDSPA
jgi:hypothetical protein